MLRGSPLIVILYLSGFIATEYVPSTDFCDASLCASTTFEHVACTTKKNQYSPNCSIDATVVPVTDELETVVLKKINDLRNQVARGGFSGLSSVSRMATVSWDQDLAFVAEMNVMQCGAIRDKCHNTMEYRNAGQTVAYRGMRGNIPDLEDLLVSQINMWFHEHEFTTMMDIINYDAKKPNEDFVQLIMANANKVGCSILQQTQNNWLQTFLTCNWARAPQLNKPIYETGPSGERCLMGRNPEYKHLCAVDEIFMDFPDETKTTGNSESETTEEENSDETTEATGLEEETTEGGGPVDETGSEETTIVEGGEGASTASAATTEGNSGAASEGESGAPTTAAAGEAATTASAAAPPAADELSPLINKRRTKKRGKKLDKNWRRTAAKKRNRSKNHRRTAVKERTGSKANRKNGRVRGKNSRRTKDKKKSKKKPKISRRTNDKKKRKAKARTGPKIRRRDGEEVTTPAAAAAPVAEGASTVAGTAASAAESGAASEGGAATTAAGGEATDDEETDETAIPHDMREEGDTDNPDDESTTPGEEPESATADEGETTTESDSIEVPSATTEPPKVEHIPKNLLLAMKFGRFMEVLDDAARKATLRKIAIITSNHEVEVPIKPDEDIQRTHRLAARSRRVQKARRTHKISMRWLGRLRPRGRRSRRLQARTKIRKRTGNGLVKWRTAPVGRK